MMCILDDQPGKETKLENGDGDVQTQIQLESCEPEESNDAE